MIVRLPWPPRELSPNARIHRMKRAGITKRTRSDTGWQCLEQGVRAWTGNLPIRVAVEFQPPRRGMDRDNMVASAKAQLDAVATCLRVDDRHFLTEFAFAEPTKGGAVTIIISEAS